MTCDGKTMVVNKSEVDPIDSRHGMWARGVPIWWLSFDERDRSIQEQWKKISGCYKGLHLS